MIVRYSNMQPNPYTNPPFNNNNNPHSAPAHKKTPNQTDNTYT